MELRGRGGVGDRLSDALYQWLKQHVDASLPKKSILFPDTISTVELQLLAQAKNSLKNLKFDQVEEPIAAMSKVPSPAAPTMRQSDELLRGVSRCSSDAPPRLLVALLQRLPTNPQWVCGPIH